MQDINHLACVACVLVWRSLRLRLRLRLCLRRYCEAGFRKRRKNLFNLLGIASNLHFSWRENHIACSGSNDKWVESNKPKHCTCVCFAVISALFLMRSGKRKYTFAVEIFDSYKTCFSSLALSKSKELGSVYSVPQQYCKIWQSAQVIWSCWSEDEACLELETLIGDSLNQSRTCTGA